jgi:hypothetical protein
VCDDTSNVVILQFCRAILTAGSSGKKYVIQHNFLKSNNCSKNRDKFAKILLEKLYKF